MPPRKRASASTAGKTKVQPAPVIARKVYVRAIPPEFVSMALSGGGEPPARLRDVSRVAVMVAHRLAGQDWSRVDVDQDGDVVVR